MLFPSLYRGVRVWCSRSAGCSTGSIRFGPLLWRTRGTGGRCAGQGGAPGTHCLSRCMRPHTEKSYRDGTATGSPEGWSHRPPTCKKNRHYQEAHMGLKCLMGMNVGGQTHLTPAHQHTAWSLHQLLNLDGRMRRHAAVPSHVWTEHMQERVVQLRRQTRHVHQHRYLGQTDDTCIYIYCPYADSYWCPENRYLIWFNINLWQIILKG